MNRQAVLACDIGGSKLLCGLVSRDGTIIDAEKIPLSPNLKIESLEICLERMYAQLRDRNPSWEITACGMTIPGLADAKRGIWVYACFSGISDYPIVSRMQEKFHLSVSIENDVNACALAEKMYGICQDCDDYLWVTVSNGVGGGLVLQGKIYQGAFGGAGEIGHVIVEEGGALCPCGHHGCLEAMAAGPAITRRYEEKTGQKIPAHQIAGLARAGNSDAEEVMAKTGEYIGKGLGKAACLLNVRRYVLGGGVMQSFDLLEEAIRKAFEKEAFERPNRKTEIVPTALHYEAGLLGAAALAWRAQGGMKRE